MATTAFPVNPTLTAIAIGWKNPDYALIADEVLPRVARTGKRFTYRTFQLADAFTVPETRVGRKSEPTVVEFGGTDTTTECLDYGLDDILPNDEIDAWEAAPKATGLVGPRERSTMLTTSLVQLDREIRVANAVFATGSYATTNRVALSGTSQWSDFTNSNPLDAMLVALDVPIMRPNVVVLGQAVWTKLRQHPRLIQAANASAQTGGAITRQQLADLLEVQKVLVGAGWVNTAARGQAPVMARVWGKSAALLFISEMLAASDQPTFGFTAQFGDKIAGTMDEPKMGLRGSMRIRVGESVREVLTSNTAGYYFSAAVA